MNRLLRTARAAVACAAAMSAVATLACTATRERPSLTILCAGALARPLRVAADSFAAREHITAIVEPAGSIETARRITDLHRAADVVALADSSLFSRLLGSRVAGRVVPLGTGRMVLAYTDRSRLANVLTAANWPDVLRHPGVEVGRSAPSLDPAGYRSLLVAQLAERFYRRPGLADSLIAAVPARNIRPKSADLVALLQTGNLDYAWEYEAVARAAGLRTLDLPPQLDLGSPTLDTLYRRAMVRVTVGRDTLEIRGAPIVFAAASLRGSDVGPRFIRFLQTPVGRRILARSGLTTTDATDADTHL